MVKYIFLKYLNPCIGIVFKVGAGAGDNVGNYNFFFMDNTIHGYVVALNDANDNAGAWGIRLTNVDGLTDEGLMSISMTVTAIPPLSVC